MTKPIVVAPIVVVAVLMLSIAVVDRIEKRAWDDRFSFNSSGAIELPAK